MANSSPLAVSKRSDSYWRATFDKPPLNLIDPETIVALRELMDTLEARRSRSSSSTVPTRSTSSPTST